MTVVAKTETRRTAGARYGFSLIEFIGVLTILVVIAAAAGPTFIKRLDYEARTTEKAVLSTLTKALLEGCVSSNEIPNAPNMPLAIAKVLNLNASQVTINARGFTRLFISDPARNINGLAAGEPYKQDNAGSTKPANARAVIVSTIAKALPAIAPTTAEFDEMWNTPEDTIPGVLSSWGGRGEDLLMERVNFAPLFHKVVLKNVDPLPADEPNLGYYSFENYGTNSVTPAQAFPFTSYYIDGTLLTLYQWNRTNADTRQILHGDISFLYQHHKWSRKLEGNDDVIGPFGELISEFIKPPAPTDPEFGATQQAVLNALYSFLWNYGNWATGDTSSSTNSAGVVKTPAVAPYEGWNTPEKQRYPNYVKLEDARDNLNAFSENLLK